MIPWRDTVLSFAAEEAVGPLLAGAEPAWVWSRDGSRILWANVAGGALLGTARFAELAARRWPAAHPLRRDIENLVRLSPERGTLARLRLRDDPYGLPSPCRCRRLRAGEERGLLVVALEGAQDRPTPAALVGFFSDPDAFVALVDPDGVALAEAGTPLPEAEADEATAEFPENGRKLRLRIATRRPPPSAVEAPGRVQDNVALLPEGSISRPEPQPEPEHVPSPADRRLAAVEAEIRRLEAELAAIRDAKPAPAGSARPPEPKPAIVDQPGEPVASEGRPTTETVTQESAADEPGSDGPASLSLVDHGSTDPQQEDAPLPADEADGELTNSASPQKEAAAQPEREERGPSISAGRVPSELSRKPIRFLWQTDAADRFLFVSPGLAQVVGRNAEIVGERWQDVAARLRLDPTMRIARALSQHDTWSGQTAWWPVEGSNVRVPAELTALPVFAIDHSFQGYRGFGVLKPAEALMPAAFDARFGAADRGFAGAEQSPPYEEAVGSAANVVPIRADLERKPDRIGLSAQERSAFEEIAAALRDRIVDDPWSIEAAEPEPERPRPSAVEAELRDRQDTPASQDDSGSHALTLVPPGAGSEGKEAAQEADVPPSAKTEAPIPESARPPVSDGEGPPVPTEPDESRPSAAAETLSAEPELPSEADGAEVQALEEALEHLAEPAPPLRATIAPPFLPDSEAQRRLREMTAVLDTATDGVLLLDADGIIESVNGSAEALFGLDAHELQGTEFAALLTAESRDAALDYLAGLKDNGVASLLNEGREVEARAGSGTIPLFMTMGRISSAEGGRFCAVLRDITHWKRTEAELVAARRAAETASSQKSDFLARVSHEIRTPLNAIIGFAEVMIEERFGPVTNERYREYLRDIRASGEHVVSLVNDLLDISKIEAGKLDLNFAAVPLNELVRECITLMQPQASRAHVVLRSSLSREVPGIVADQRTLRQIVLNLLSNSVKFTGPGGQVIASTSLAESGEALLRIRDTGEGMSEAELARALEPFRQLNTASLADRNGTGLGLPLTRALVEANRASFAIRSAPGEGTVVTVTFPPTRVLSE